MALKVSSHFLCLTILFPFLLAHTMLLCVELLLWIIYAGLQFQYSTLIITSVYSILIVILYSGLGAVFYNQKRSQSQNHRTPIGHTNNDSGTNNATTIEVHQT
ncbi:hypothetical protein RhiirC2_441853 [Rhizophagus irregularis]|uniref:Uncharacterized protein n=1 Tax=Rhizophagus irregularis TaxID=588596 RepID=A0A2N1NAX0_9GLOM|nr:hypothetical protein RhiirC2_441853 [Rhizophagus irregularis]